MGRTAFSRTLADGSGPHSILSNKLADGSGPHSILSNKLADGSGPHSILSNTSRRQWAAQHSLEHASTLIFKNIPKNALHENVKIFTVRPL